MPDAVVRLENGTKIFAADLTVRHALATVVHAVAGDTPLETFPGDYRLENRPPPDVTRCGWLASGLVVYPELK